MFELILGGARSGKSSFAEQLALESGLEIIYIATATVGDSEMATRIALHQQTRPKHWQTIETPVDLAKTLQTYAHPQACLLVDCLTLWLNNCLFDETVCWETQKQLLLEQIAKLPGRQILVSNEVGQGIVPLGAISRQFVDESGHLHQKLASLADRVFLVIAGLPQLLKGKL
jgi:adenosylcobinamide kinase/adenosylcobinamide-phosphate guanylyltransferase